MIFPSKDRVLFTQELGTYGITYADSLDCLLVAPALKGHPDRVYATVAYVSPFDIVGLLRCGEEFLGVVFPSITELLYYFWNGRLPENIPTDYLADMIDLCLADLQCQHIVADNEELMRARVMHACARHLMQGSGVLPRVIVERLRDTLGTCSSTIH